MTAKFETLWDAVKDEIVSLGLTGLDANSIKQWQVNGNPKENEITQGALLTPYTEIEGPNGTNLSTDIGYGFNLTLFQSSNSKLTKNYAQAWLESREKIRRHFHHQSPLTAISCYRCTVEMGKVILPDAWLKQYDASALIIRCWVLEKGI